MYGANEEYYSSPRLRQGSSDSSASPNRWILEARRLPGRLTAEEAAVLIGCQTHDIPVLIRKRLLAPLADGPRNCVKYFARVEVEDLCKDKKWLDLVTAALMRGQYQEASATPKKAVGVRPLSQ